MSDDSVFNDEFTLNVGVVNRESRVDVFPNFRSIAIDFPSTGTTYDEVFFERLAFRDGENKCLMSYDNSLLRLRNAGYSRLPSAKEVFGIRMAGLENRLKLSGYNRQVYNDLSNGYVEFLSLAISFSCDKIITYFDPYNLVLDVSEKRYIFIGKDIQCNASYHFPAKGLRPDSRVSLKELPPDLISILFGRKLKNIPDKLLKDESKLLVDLPKENEIWPVSTGGYLLLDTKCLFSASRGVKR